MARSKKSGHDIIEELISREKEDQEHLEFMGVFFLEDIGKDNVRAFRSLRKSLLRAAADDQIKVIQIFINCTGGPIMEALSTYDTIKSISKKYKKQVMTIAMGACYSGACLVLQAGDVRISFENSELMIHDIQVSNLDGSLDEVSRYINAVKRNRTRMYNIFAKRMHMSQKKLAKLINEHKEYWLDAQEALKKNLIDEVI